VKDYGKISQPLNALLKKDAFHWREEVTHAFEELKAAMRKLPILALPDFSKSFILEIDASGTGLGAVLLQEEKPLAFWSKALSDRAQLKSVYERELMTMVLAVKKWRHYLLGKKFLIRTDQRSLKFLNEQRLMREEQSKWAIKLIGYDFDIQYRPSKENIVVDALSRQFSFSTISLVQEEEWADWEEEIQVDPQLYGIYQGILTKTEEKPGYTIHGGKLYIKYRLVLSRNSTRIHLLLKELHDSPLGGHSRFFRTFKRVANEVFWQGMKKTIRDYVAACEICQRNKTN